MQAAASPAERAEEGEAIPVGLHSGMRASWLADGTMVVTASPERAAGGESGAIPPKESGLSLRLSQWGYPGAMQRADAPEGILSGPEIAEAGRPGIVEWYRNHDCGIEHGFTVENPPGPASDAPLQIEMAVESALLMEPVTSDRIGWRTADGTGVWDYGKLVVTDAAGRELDSSLTCRTGPDPAILLAIDDRTARYPLTIDPLLVSRELAEIAFPPGSTSMEPSNLTRLGDLAFFTALDTAYGRELWVTDGTTEGTRMVADLAPGIEGYQSGRMVPFQGMMYFDVYRSDLHTALWKSDGTTAGTVPVTTDSGPLSRTLLGKLGDSLLFYGTSAGESGREGFWRFYANSFDLLPYRELSLGGGSPTPGPVIGDIMYFTIRNESGGYSLGRTDGTGAGTIFLDTIGNDNSNSWMAAAGGLLYYWHPLDEDGMELRTTDGTPAGRRQLGSFLSSPGGLQPYNLTTAGDAVYFAA